MVDQDLDALLVGALYGELGPAEEARLAAHLESHPSDRSVLADLRSLRTTLVESRFFELRFDAPPSVSALLVQEAARRAPRAVGTGDGWFTRLARSFASHPAMAAATMLVVVVGVAGTLYMERGADLARPAVQEAERSVPSVVASAPAAIPAVTPAPPPAQPVPGDSFGADLADKELEQKSQLAKLGAPGPAKVAIATTGKKEKLSRSEGIIVSQRDAQPKDLDRAEEGVAVVDMPPPAPPPPAASPARNDDKTLEPAQASTATGGAGGDGRKASLNAEDGWAREQHARVASLVRAGRCEEAAPLAVAVNTRAPDYYNAYVATDRSLKQCMQYIASAVEKQEVTRARAAAAKAAKAAPPADATK